MRLIDADALEKDANEDLLNYPDTVEEVYWNDGAKSIIDLIKTAPTIDPVKHGKWKQAWDDLRCRFVFECSACGQPRSGVSEWNYCPTCGTRMDGE